MKLFDIVVTYKSGFNATREGLTKEEILEEVEEYLTLAPDSMRGLNVKRSD